MPLNKIGLVLSGGGTRGIAHLGLLQVLDELQVKPSIISGVSAGALIGAMYSAGKTPEEILSIAKKSINFGFSNFLWKKGGFFSREFLFRILLEHIPHNSFEELGIPLYVNAVDFLKNETIYFSKGELIPCLEASSAVPLLFSPAEFQKSVYVDGGLLNNFPVEPLLGKCDKIIGVHVNKLEEYDHVQARFSRFTILERCYHMSIANSVYAKVPLCDIFIEPSLHSFGMLHIKKADEIFERGYKAAAKEKENILSLVEKPWWKRLQPRRSLPYPFSRVYNG